MKSINRLSAYHRVSDRVGCGEFVHEEQVLHLVWPEVAHIFIALHRKRDRVLIGANGLELIELATS